MSEPEIEPEATSSSFVNDTARAERLAPLPSDKSHALPQRGPQRIVVLCDGTWQQRRSVVSAVTNGGVQTGTSDEYYTNVALLSQCILPSATPSAAPPGAAPYVMPQIVYYQDGIGASPYAFAKLFEGATGSSLDLKVQEAYSFLVDNFQHGDQLYFFGFSRGAYTARSLAGFINYVGIMTRAQRSRSLADIWRAFRRRNPAKPDTVFAAEQVVFEALGKWPSGNAMYSARLNMKGAQVLAEQSFEARLTGESVHAEDAWLAVGGQEHAAGASAASAAASSTPPPPNLRFPRVVPPTIEVVGVWDTVGALGIPGSFTNPQLVQYYSFFDPMLAPNVRHAFHAIALSEDRKDFRPTIWSLPTHERPCDAARRSGQELQQVWFQGSHSDVGGGHAWHGLSDITLAWMMAQLCDRAPGEAPLLHLDLVAARTLQDFRVKWAQQQQHPSRLALTFQATRQVGGWQTAQGEAQASAPQTNESIHHSVFVGGQYNPQSSPQFADLRHATGKGQGDVSLKILWDSASLNEDVSLGPTERFMKWSDEESVAAAQGGALQSTPKLAPKDGTQPGIPTIDPELPPERPERIPVPVWKGLRGVCYAPLLVASYVVNWKQPILHHTIVPQQNLQPPAVLKLVQTLLSKMSAKPAKKPAAANRASATAK